MEFHIEFYHTVTNKNMNKQNDNQLTCFGHHDASYQAAGELEGLTKLVDAFYRHMGKHSFSRKIFEMHPENIAVSREKLTFFLCGWLGGPKLYQEKYGGISIPGVHQHLAVGEEEKMAWLRCMQLAIDEQRYSPEFAKYLLQQLSVPANRVEFVCRRSEQR